MKNTCLLSAVLLAALLTSCNGLNKHDDAYYDAFFARRNTAFANYSADAKKALNSVDSLYANTNSPSPYFKFLVMNFRSSYYYYGDKKDTAAFYVDSCITALEQGNLTQKYPQFYASSLNARGDYYYNANEIDKAFEYYSRSRLISRTLENNACAMGNQSYHLGMVTYRQEKYNEAADYFKQAYAGISSCEHDSVNYYWLQEIISNTALAYTRLDQNDSAKKYYLMALSYLQTEAPKYSYSGRQKKMAEIASGVIMGNLAKTYMALNIMDTAEQLLLKSLSINDRPGYEISDAEFTNLQLAQLYFKTHRLPETFKVLQHLRSALDTLKNTNVEMRWRKLASQYHMATKQPALAGHYMESFLALKDSLDKNMKGLKRTDYGQLLREQENQYQIKLLTKDNQLSQLYLLITIGFIIVAIVIMSLIFYNYRKSRKNVMVLTDLNRRISEQKTNLEKALQDLQVSNEDKDRILRIVAHDLRTPVSAIMMIGNILIEDETDETKRGDLEMIVNASQSMISLTEELLEFSGNNKQEHRGEKEMVDAREIAKQTVGLLQFKAEEKKQKINLSAPGEPTNIYAYKEKISRLLSNLITNAIKFSPENSEIDVWIMKKAKSVLIQVKDSGIGIPEKMINNVFDSFTSAKRYGTAGERSFGLGLSICKQIAEAHNGKIWVSSTEGKGSSFFIEIPLA